MSAALHKTVEEACTELSELIDAAEEGRSTIIIKDGRSVAALVPIKRYRSAVRQQPLLPLAGSGSGLWRKGSSRMLRRLRDEWGK
jgi:prevent-host-death family protein